MAGTKAKARKEKQPDDQPKGWASGIPVWCSHHKIILITSLRPNPRNAKPHPQKQIDLLAARIKGDGWREPIVISKLSGMISSGHLRRLAAMKLELAEVPVEYQEFEDERDEEAFCIADNKIKSYSELNEQKVGKLIYEDMEGFEPGHALFGYTEEELTDLKLDDHELLEEKDEDEEDEEEFSGRKNVGQRRIVLLYEQKEYDQVNRSLERIRKIQSMGTKTEAATEAIMDYAENQE